MSNLYQVGFKKVVANNGSPFGNIGADRYINIATDTIQNAMALARSLCFHDEIIHSINLQDTPLIVDIDACKGDS